MNAWCTYEEIIQESPNYEYLLAEHIVGDESPYLPRFRKLLRINCPNIYLTMQPNTPEQDRNKTIQDCQWKEEYQLSGNSLWSREYVFNGDIIKDYVVNLNGKGQPHWELFGTQAFRFDSQTGAMKFLFTQNK